MTMGWRALAGMILATLSGAAFADPPHRPAHPPLASALPAPVLAGDPATRLARAYSGRKIDVATYHYDNNRTGWNAAETDLTPATVASGQFGLLATLAVDGNVLAQPLLLSGFALPDGRVRDLLIVATGHNSVYAFDAQTYALVWRATLGPPQSTASVGCEDVHPGYGISSTPVIARSGPGTAAIYVVAATEPQPGVFHTALHALDAATGRALTAPARIAPQARLDDGAILHFDPQNQWNRAGLALQGDALYIGIGSHCDHNDGAISGWLLRYGTDLQPRGAFHTIGTTGGLQLASIWMTGFAPAIDSGGDVLVVTGNGHFDAGLRDWGQSVLRLPPTLARVKSSFTPASYPTLNDNDLDFGAGGVMLLPPLPGQHGPHLAVALGKPGTLYLLNAAALGGVQPGDAGALQALPMPGGGLWGGPAYWNGPAGPAVFTQTGWDVLRAWTVRGGSAPSFSLRATGRSVAGYGGSLPIVSSNGAQPGSGVVWLIDRATEPFALEAYDAEALGAPIFSAQVGYWSSVTQGNAFLTPMQANGRVYAPGYRLVRVYGLTP